MAWRAGPGQWTPVPEEKASSSRGVLPFSPYGCGRLTGCSSCRGRMLSIWTHEVHRLSSVTTAGSPWRHCRDTQGFRAALKRLRKGSTSGWSEIPILLDLESHSTAPCRQAWFIQKRLTNTSKQTFVESVFFKGCRGQCCIR